MPHLFDITTDNVRKTIDSCLREGENADHLVLNVDPEYMWRVPTHHTKAGRILNRIPQGENGKYKFLAFASLADYYLTGERKASFIAELKRIAEEEEKTFTEEKFRKVVVYISAEFFIMPDHQSCVTVWDTGTTMLTEDPTEGDFMDTLSDFVPFNDYKYKKTINIPDYLKYQAEGFQKDVIATTFGVDSEVCDYISGLLEEGKTSVSDYWKYGDYLKKMFRFL